MKHRDLIVIMLLAVAVFAGLALYGDLPELLDQVAAFPLAYWGLALGLALANYGIRLVRWHFFLRVLGIRIRLVPSAAIFLSGLSMTVSPGRVGELAKCYFLKDRLGVPIARSAAAVIAERIMDVFSVLLLSIWGLFLVPYGWAVAVVLLVAFVTFVLFVVSSWGSSKLLRLPMPGRWRPFLTSSRDAFQEIFTFKPVLLALALSLLAWFAEGAALWLVLRGMDAPGSPGQAVSIYAAATLLGAVTMLPGGLVGTEGGMVALLGQLDMTKTQASTATFIVRVCTLWFAVFLGGLALIYVQVHMPRRLTEEADPTGTYPEPPGQAS